MDRFRLCPRPLRFSESTVVISVSSRLHRYHFCRRSTTFEIRARSWACCSHNNEILSMQYVHTNFSVTLQHQPRGRGRENSPRSDGRQSTAFAAASPLWGTQDGFWVCVCGAYTPPTLVALPGALQRSESVPLATVGDDSHEDRGIGTLIWDANSIMRPSRPPAYLGRGSRVLWEGLVRVR